MDSFRTDPSNLWVRLGEQNLVVDQGNEQAIQVASINQVSSTITVLITVSIIITCFYMQVIYNVRSHNLEMSIYGSVFRILMQCSGWPHYGMLLMTYMVGWYFTYMGGWYSTYMAGWYFTCMAGWYFTYMPRYFTYMAGWYFTCMAGWYFTYMPRYFTYMAGWYFTYMAEPWLTAQQRTGERGTHVSGRLNLPQKQAPAGTYSSLELKGSANLLIYYNIIAWL